MSYAKDYPNQSRKFHKFKQQQILFHYLWIEKHCQTKTNPMLTNRYLYKTAKIKISCLAKAIKN